MTYQTLLHEVLVWLLLAIPEGIMMVFAGLGCLGVRRPGKTVAAVGFAVGTTSSILRMVVPGGFHVPFVLVAYIILVATVMKVSAKTAVVACFVSTLLVNLGQIVVALPVLRITGLSFASTLTSLPLHLAFGWLGDVVLLIAACWVFVTQGVLFRVPESSS